MDNKNLTNESALDNPADLDTSVDYIQALNELRQNSVDRSKYDELRTENKRLINSIVNGQGIEVETPKQEADIQALRNKLFNTNEPLSSLEYVSTALELRKALIEKGETDPFLPQGAQISPTLEDINTANRVAEAFQSCVDYADGDGAVFVNELQRITNDVKIRR